MSDDVQRDFYFAPHRNGKPIGPSVVIRHHDILAAFRVARERYPQYERAQLILHAIEKPETS